MDSTILCLAKTMEGYLAIEEWSSLVRQFKDAEKAYGMRPYDTEQLCRDVLRHLQYTRIRQYNLFTQQRGEEFERLVASLEGTYSPAAVQRFLQNEDLWKTTLAIGER